MKVIIVTKFMPVRADWQMVEPALLFKWDQHCLARLVAWSFRFWHTYCKSAFLTFLSSPLDCEAREECSFALSTSNCCMLISRSSCCWLCCYGIFSLWNDVGRRTHNQAWVLSQGKEKRIWNSIKLGLEGGQGKYSWGERNDAHQSQREVVDIRSKRASG